MTEPTFYHVLSICTEDQSSLGDLHEMLLIALLGLNLGKDALRYRFVPSRGTFGFEYQFDVRDLDPVVTDALLDMARLFLEALPWTTPVRIYTYWRDPNVPMRTAASPLMQRGQRERPFEKAYVLGVMVPSLSYKPTGSLSYRLAGPLSPTMAQSDQVGYYRIVSLWSKSDEEHSSAYRTFLALLNNKGTMPYAYDPSFFRVIERSRDDGHEYAFCARERAPIVTQCILNAAQLFVRTLPKVDVFVYRWHRRECQASVIKLTVDTNMDIELDDNRYIAGTFEKAENLPKRYENDWSRATIQEPTVFSNTVKKDGSGSIFDTDARKTTNQSSFALLQHQAAALDAQLKKKDAPDLETLRHMVWPKDTWTGQTTAAEYYCIISLYASTRGALDAAYSTFMQHMCTAYNETKLRVRTVDKHTSIEYMFDVLDLHQQTVEFIKDAALAWVRTNPHSTVHVFSYWRDPMDNQIETIMRVYNHWPNPLNAHAQLGALVSKDVEEGVAPIDGWSGITGDPATSTTVGAPYDQTRSLNAVTGQKYSTEKELQAVLDATRPESTDTLPMFRKAMLEEMGWKPPTDAMMDPESDMFHKCMDHTRWADYRAVPCKHPFICNECMVDYNKYLAHFCICPRCEKEITGIEHVAFVPEMPEIHIPSSVYDLNVLEDYADDADMLDYGSYHSSDFEEDAMEYEDEKGVYEDEKGVYEDEKGQS